MYGHSAFKGSNLIVIEGDGLCLVGNFSQNKYAVGMGGEWGGKGSCLAKFGDKRVGIYNSSLGDCLVPPTPILKLTQRITDVLGSQHSRGRTRNQSLALCLGTEKVFDFAFIDRTA